MSQENIVVVKRAISAINERDVDAYLALCNPNFVLINPMAPIEGPNRGEGGIRDFFEGINEGARRFELKIGRLQALADDRVIAWLTLHVESEGGFSQTQSLTNLYELEGGKLSRVRVFRDPEEALEAAGLEE